MVAPKLEIAPGVAATVEPTAPQWVDVSAYLYSFQVDTGRQEQLDQVEAGTATFVLKNQDRRFDPEHAFGPYYPNVLPMMHIRFTEGGSSGKVFRGYVDTWRQTWPGAPQVQTDARVVVPCTDAFKVLANLKIARSVWEREIQKLVDASTVKAWFRLNDPKGQTRPVCLGTSKASGVSRGTPAFGQDSLLPFGAADETAVRFPEGADGIAGTSQCGITTNNWTLHLLVKSDAKPTGASQALFYQGSSGQGAIWLIVDTSGQAIAYVWLNGTILPGIGGVVAAFNICNGKPHVVTVRRDYAAGTGALKVYIDGTELGSSAINDATVQDPTGGIALGYDLTNGAFGTINTWGGLIQEAVLIESAQTPTVIANVAAYALAPLEGSTIEGALQAALTDVAWPAGLTDLGTGASLTEAHALNGGSVLEYAKRLTDTEEGTLYTAPDGKVTFRGRNALSTSPLNTPSVTFGDGGSGSGEIPYLNVVLDPADEHVANQARVAREGGVEQIVKDASSQTSYFARQIERTGTLHRTDDEALQHGNWLVSRFKKPRTTVSSLVLKLADPRVPAATVLGLPLGQVVTIKRRPKDGQGAFIGAAITKTARVEGFTHEGDRDPSTWTVTLWLSGYDATVDQPLIWDDATYGTWDARPWGI